MTMKAMLNCYHNDLWYDKSKKEMEELAAMTEGLLIFAKQYNIAINDPLLVRRYEMDQDAKREEAFKISLAERRGKEDFFQTRQRRRIQAR